MRTARKFRRILQDSYESSRERKMKVVNIAYAMIKLQFKLPQTLRSRGFTRRTVLRYLNPFFGNDAIWRYKVHWMFVFPLTGFHDIKLVFRDAFTWILPDTSYF